MIPQDIIVPRDAVSSTSVLVVGAGGVGSWATELLCRAGFKVGVIDPDKVEERNLHRQLHNKIGMLKVDSLKRDFCDLKTYAVPLTSANAHDLIGKYDVVLDCTDNMQTRYLIDSVCSDLNKRWVHTSALARQVQIMRVDPQDVCFSCVFRKMKDDSCDVAGVLGSTVLVAAGLGVNEVFNIVLGKTGSIVYFLDLDSMEFHKVKPRPCDSCGTDSDLRVIELCGNGQFSASVPKGIDLNEIEQKASSLGFTIYSKSKTVLILSNNGQRISVFPSGNIIFSGFDSKHTVYTLYKSIFK